MLFENLRNKGMNDGYYYYYLINNYDFLDFFIASNFVSICDVISIILSKLNSTKITMIGHICDMVIVLAEV